MFAITLGLQLNAKHEMSTKLHLAIFQLVQNTWSFHTCHMHMVVGSISLSPPSIIGMICTTLHIEWYLAQSTSWPPMVLLQPIESLIVVIWMVLR